MFSHLKLKLPSHLLLILTMAGFLSACSAPGKQFYILTAEAPTSHKSSKIGIGVGPITIASYLDRPNLVFQQKDNQLIIAESHRWAGNLEDHINRALATNLGRLMGTPHVRTYPWQGDEGLRYQITIDIDTLHANAEGDAVIEAKWRVYSLPDRGVVSQGSWSGTEPLQADGYHEMIAAQSRLLATFAAQIANSLTP